MHELVLLLLITVAVRSNNGHQDIVPRPQVQRHKKTRALTKIKRVPIALRNQAQIVEHIGWWISPRIFCYIVCIILQRKDRTDNLALRMVEKYRSQNPTVRHYGCGVLS
jgi:hypothetical protein